MAEDRQHQALYRRYRPQTPAEVLGQDHVVRALTGAIRDGRLHHAFLFCGPRGTGKTSTARILAKMVNCATGPTAEPCGGCDQCVSIREGTHLDVVEIDAASHGGVEDARELREKAPTAPVQGREKVYIIDEAQRLSREAFDALLKVFEEPPPGVRFVLATTEPHKMPATIVGRCQRFDFRRHTMEGLSELLQKVAASEGVTLDDSAAHAIARHAEGSARDALSLLDQAGVLGGQKVDDAAIQALLGAPRSQVQVELADGVAVGDARSAFEIVNRLVQDGQDLRNVTNETLAHFRDLLLVKTAPGQEDLLDIPADAYEGLRMQAEKFSSAELARVIELLLAAQGDMRWTTSPRLSLELALVRATIPETDASPAGTLARLERLERLANVDPATVVPAAGVSDGALAAAVVPVGDPTPPVVRSDTAPAESEEPPGPTEAIPEASEKSRAEAASAPAETDPVATDAPHAASADSVDVTMLRRSWPSLLDHLSQVGQPVLRALLESATPATFDGETLELAFPPSFRNNLRQVASRADKLQAALGDLFGIRPRIESVTREAHAGGTEPAAVAYVEEAEEPSEEEALKRLKDVLGATPADDPDASED
ncbi:MAG TPA: DNA polymerase III subunit gamma/tau [Actinomycetota bacterium]|nr:DNA polymerase III subunit gamma/tau [Actinomycetota bacterium]